MTEVLPVLSPADIVAEPVEQRWLIRELWGFMRENRKLWLLPILAVTAVLAILLVLAEGSEVAPFIYTIF